MEQVVYQNSTKIIEKIIYDLDGEGTALSREIKKAKEYLQELELEMKHIQIKKSVLLEVLEKISTQE